MKNRMHAWLAGKHASYDTLVVTTDWVTSTFDTGLFITDYDSHNLEWKQND
jgi:hypothetical protein